MFSFFLFQSESNVPDLCAICQDILRNAMKLKCEHSFCTTCINTWLQTANVCPICRKKINSTRDSSSSNTIVVLDSGDEA